MQCWVTLNDISSIQLHILMLLQPFKQNPVAASAKHIVLLGRFFAGRQSKVMISCCRIDKTGGSAVIHCCQSNHDIYEHSGSCLVQGHLVAISVFRDILGALPNGTELHLVGNLMPGHDDYMAQVKKVSLDNWQ